MAAIGPTLFVVILWGAILAVACVFGYEVYAIARDAGWLSG